MTPIRTAQLHCWWPVDGDILDIFGPQIHDYTWLYNIIHAHCVPMIPMSLRGTTHILTILGLQTSVWVAKQHIQVEHIYIYLIYLYIDIQWDSTRVFVLVVLSRTRSFRNVLSESKRTKPLIFVKIIRVSGTQKILQLWLLWLVIFLFIRTWHQQAGNPCTGGRFLEHSAGAIAMGFSSKPCLITWG